MKSKLIAVSAISSALISIFLTIGAYVEFVDIIAILFSSAFVIIPLYYKSYKACFLTYLAGGLLGALFSLPMLLKSIVFPAYFGFFGLCPILVWLFKDKKINNILTYILFGIWFIIIAYGIYFFYVFVMNIPINDLPKIISDNIYLFIFIFAILFYIVYLRFTYLLRVVEDRLLRKIIK